MPPTHLTDSRTTNFYYSFLFLPPEKRRAIEAVYYFARRSDDAADDLRNPAAAATIEKYRNLLDQCFRPDGDALEGAGPQALAEAIRRFKIPRQPFEDLLHGLEMDLQMDATGRRYETFSELELYCYRVASAIGLISIEIFGYRNPQTREYAVNLGKALQMVNILRDIQTDARRGRVYLPREDLLRFDVDPGSFASGPWSVQFEKLMRYEGERAHTYFDKSRQLLAPEDRKSMKAAEIMGAIYWGLLRRMERNSFNVFGERARLSRPRKLWTALKVYMGADWRK